MKTGKHTEANAESKASAHHSTAKKSMSAFSLSQSAAMSFTAKATEGAAEPIQLFPHQVKHNATNTTFIAKLDGAYIRLYDRAQQEVAYFQIQVTAHDWGMKNIYVHGGGLQGMGIGTLLLYFAAKLAHGAGIGQLTVLTPSGANLWTNNGFTATPRDSGPPDITATPAQVLAATAATIQGFTITDYPAAPAKLAPPAKDPRRFDDQNSGPGGMFEL